MHTATSQSSEKLLVGPENSDTFCTFKVRLKGQILRLSSCYIVNQENSNFGLHQFFEGPFLSEKKTLCVLLLPPYVS